MCRVEQIRRTYIPLREVNWRWVLGVFGTIFICLFFYRQLDFVANGEHRSPFVTFSEEGTGVLAGLVVFPFAYLVAIRFPLVSKNWRRNLLAHLAAVCLISIVHTTFIIIVRSTVFPHIGLGRYGYGSLPVRYPMEFAHFFIFYWVGVSLISLFHEVRFTRERELQQAKLEANLAEAQLQNLRLQLEPHFLFNALNAISAAIYEDPRVADEMVCRLSDLLRQLLKSDRSQQVPLARELELLQLYTRIMQARLEHRLKLHVEVEAAAEVALVPQLLLQPLIENAIQHGMDPFTFGVHITLSVSVQNGQLAIFVRDRGPGLASQPLAKGIGLSNTEQRLSRLYGNEQSLSIRAAPDKGAIVEIRIPFQAAAQPAFQTVPAPSLPA